MEKNTQPLQGWWNHKDRLWHWVSSTSRPSLEAGLKSWRMPGVLIWWFCQCWALEIIDTQGDEALKTTKNNLLKSYKLIYAALCLDVSNCHANFNDLSSMRLAAIVFELESFTEEINYFIFTVHKTISWVYLVGILLDSKIEALIAGSQLHALLVVCAGDDLDKDSRFFHCKVSEQSTRKSCRIDWLFLTSRQ